MKPTHVRLKSEQYEWLRQYCFDLKEVQNMAGGKKLAKKVLTREGSSLIIISDRRSSVEVIK